MGRLGGRVFRRDLGCAANEGGGSGAAEGKRKERCVGFARWRGGGTFEFSDGESFERFGGD